MGTMGQGTRWISVAAAAIVFAIGGTAMAASHEHEESEMAEQAHEEELTESGLGEEAIQPEVMEEAEASEADQESPVLHEPWRYNTDYFFGLTRGLEEAGCSGRCRPAVMVLTVPLDVGLLPGAALSALWG